MCPEVTEKEQMYVALFAEQASRGLSLSGLSRETGIPTGTLSWWRKEIRRREVRRRTPAPASSAFVPVTLRDSAVSSVGAGFELMLPNGVRLHVPPVFDEGALHRLVATVASAC